MSIKDRNYFKNVLENDGLNELISRIKYWKYEEYNYTAQPIKTSLTPDGSPYLSAQYILLNNDEELRRYTEYVSNSGNYDLPISVTNRTQSPLLITIRNIQVCIKTFLSFLLNELKFEVLKYITNYSDVLPMNTLKRLQSFFINNDSELLFNSETKRESGMTIDMLKYVECVSNYSNGLICNNELERINLPYDLSRLKLQTMLTPTNIKRGVRNTPLQKLYDLHYVEYLYNNAFYQITSAGETGKLSMEFMIEGINPPPGFVPGVQVVNNITPFNFNPDGDWRTHINNVLSPANIQLAATDLQQKQAIMENNTTNTVSDNYRNLRKSIILNANMYALLAVTEEITKINPDGPNGPNGPKLDITDVQPNNTVYYYIEVDIIPNDIYISQIRRQLINPRNLLFTGVPGVGIQPAITDKYKYFKLFSDKKFMMYNIRIKNNFYKFRLTFSQNANGVYNYDESIDMTVELLYNNNSFNQDKLRRILIKIEVIDPLIQQSRLALKTVTPKYMNLNIYKYFYTTNCENITNSGIIQHANNEYKYLEKISISDTPLSLTTLENLVLLESFFLDSTIDEIWNSYETVYDALRREGLMLKDKLYNYTTYHIKQNKKDRISADYVEDKRMVNKRRFISLIIYLIRTCTSIKAYVTKIRDTELKKVVDIFSPNFLGPTQFNVESTDFNVDFDDIPGRFQLKIEPLMQLFYTYQPNDPNHLCQSEYFDNIMNGYYVYVLYKYLFSKEAAQQPEEAKYQINNIQQLQNIFKFTIKLSQDVVQNRVKNWATGIFEPPVQPPTNVQIQNLTRIKLVNNGPIPLDAPYEHWSSGLDPFGRTYYQKTAVAPVPGLEPPNVPALSDSSIIQWDDPRIYKDFKTTNEGLRIIYSMTAEDIMVGDTLLRYYSYLSEFETAGQISTEQIPPIPPFPPIGWQWKLPYIYKNDITQAYNNALEAAKQTAIQILNEYYTAGGFDIEPEIEEIDNLVATNPEPIYAIALYVNTKLRDIYFTDQTSYPELKAMVDKYDNAENTATTYFNEITNFNITNTAIANNSSLTTPDYNDAYREHITRAYIPMIVENEKLNQDVIRIAINTAQKMLKQFGLINKHFDPKYTIEKQNVPNARAAAAGAPAVPPVNNYIILPYGGTHDKFPNYIEKCIPDVNDFLADYVFDDRTNDASTITMNNTSVCDELSKIINTIQTTTTGNKISALPVNTLDDVSLMIKLGNEFRNTSASVNK